MIIYEVKNLKYGTHRYVAELINQAEINVYNRHGLEALLEGTPFITKWIGTVLVDKFTDPETAIDTIYKRAKSYLIEDINEVIGKIFTTNPTVVNMKQGYSYQKKEVPISKPTPKTTESILNDLASQYLNAIRLMHRMEINLSKARSILEEGLHEIEEEQYLEKTHNNTKNSIDK